MIGFTAALANEAITGASLWQQLYFAPYAYLSAYLLVVAAAQLNRAFGSPNKGRRQCNIEDFRFFGVLKATCSIQMFDHSSMCSVTGQACIHFVV